MILSVVRLARRITWAGNEDHLADERPEFHGDVTSTISLEVHHQGNQLFRFHASVAITM